jgi:hypothetical protein
MFALPPAEPPARVVAGVQVTWPLAKPETVLAPGSKLTVRIASKRRRAQVSFVRVNATGKGLATVARRTLRRGAFTVAVPPALGARYALRVTVAGRKRFSWVTTPPPLPAPIPEATPVPAAGPPPVPYCPNPQPPGSWPEPEVLLGPTPVRPGDTLAYSVTNRFNDAIRVMSGAVLARSTDPRPDWTGAATTLEGGASESRTFVIPDDLEPGTYVLGVAANAGECDIVYPDSAATSAPFEVLPG